MTYEMKINKAQETQYIEKGYWTKDTLLERFEKSVENFGEREYVADDRGNRYTYREMDRASSKIAAYLKEAGVKKGDVVSFQIPVWSEFIIVVYGCIKVGAVMHPIAMCYEEEDLVHGMNLTQSKVYFGPTWFHKSNYEARIKAAKDKIPSLTHMVLLDNLKEKEGFNITLAEILKNSIELLPSDYVRSDASDLALILCTSGTTGGTKGVMLTHNNIIFSEDYFNRELDLNEESIMFMPAPLNHATGFHHGIIAPMLMGAKVVLQQKFKCPEALEIINKEKCTYSMGSTPFIYDILKELEEHGGELKTLKFYLCGGAPVPGYMVQKADSFGIKLCEVYGSTESVPHIFVKPKEALNLNGKGAGHPMEGVEVRIVDEQGNDVLKGCSGEEISRGPNVFVGYIRNKEATERVLTDDGWFYSGDICIEDKEGNISIVGRKKDLIVRGGENLNSNRIDNDMEGCPGVRDHAVIGMPDERLGERICAYLVTEAQRTVTLEDVVEHFKRKQVPKRFWPERVEIIQEIPRTPSGKVKKYILLEDLKKRMKQTEESSHE